MNIFKKYKFKKIDAIIVVSLIIIAGVILFNAGILPGPPEPESPAINFEQDKTENKLIVISVSSVIKWSDILIEGNCNTSGLSTYVVIGDEITQCDGKITIIYRPADTVLGSWNFVKIDDLPISLPFPPSSPKRGITPEDERAHFDDMLSTVTREWWSYNMVFDKDSDLAGWAVTISFNHMARNDLILTKPDMMVLTLHGPNGEEYGGVVNNQRGGGIIWDPTLKVKSSDKEIIIEYEKSYVQGMHPEWIIHIEDDQIDQNHEIVMDLKFFAPELAIWTYHNRFIAEGKSNIASYMFTGCKVTGKIIINGNEHTVKGIGQHEHSWSTSLIKSLISGWDWSHITLENGWNIYYSNYYLTSQIKSSTNYRINPLGTMLITTDKGRTITLLKDIEIKIEDSEKVSLLVKTPTEMSINAKPGVTQPLLKTYDIVLDLNIEFKDSISEKFGLIDIVGMNIGRSTVSGKITWTDDDGDHDISLTGISSMWTMRH